LDWTSIEENCHGPIGPPSENETQKEKRMRDLLSAISGAFDCRARHTEVGESEINENKKYSTVTRDGKGWSGHWEGCAILLHSGKRLGGSGQHDDALPNRLSPEELLEFH